MNFPAVPANAPEEAKAIIESYKEEKAIELAKQAEDIKAGFMDVIAKQSEWLKDIQATGVEMLTPKGESYLRDGRQYIFENAGRMKDLAATAQLLTTGSDGTGSPVILAVTGRTGEKPVKEMEGDFEVTQVIED